jgi:hypothetical protein
LDEGNIDDILAALTPSPEPPAIVRENAPPAALVPQRRRSASMKHLPSLESSIRFQDAPPLSLIVVDPLP